MPTTYTSMKIDPYEAATRLRILTRNLTPGNVANETAYCRTYLQSANGQLTMIVRDLVKARTAIANRHPKDRDMRLRRIEERIGVVAQAIKNTRDHLNRIDNASQTAEGQVNNAVDEIRMLVQALPTEPNLPTNHAENVLRAITVVLENNGYTKRRDQ